MEVFRIDNLTFRYPEQDRKVLEKINLSVSNGEFISICGKSGCGKSTLLRHMKTVLTPHGQRSGNVFFCNKPLEEATLREQAAKIGFVMQNPDNQIVTDKVWHELAFGLESLGFNTATIRLRVAEMASFFGIQTWFMKNVAELSGGQKQLLNLASIMAMQPSVLILDEPTSQLDPIAAVDFLEAVKRINRELGVTVIITEHRMEDVFPSSDRVIVMDDGKFIADDLPEKVGKVLKKLGHHMFATLPAPMQIYAGVENSLACPVTVRDGRNWLEKLARDKPIRLPTEKKIDDIDTSSPEVISIKEAWFRYDRGGADIIKGLSANVKQGEILCLLGGNGTGKTTTLMLISGLLRPYRGKVLLFGKDVSKYKSEELFNHCLGVLPQNPQALFVKKTVELDLLEMLDKNDGTKEERTQRIREVATLVQIDDLLGAHPYDLSGGEQQRAALAKVLLLNPKLLLLDEPTKGLDNHFKDILGHILHDLQKKGTTILIVSHDIEFCAKYADRCAMLFDGNIVTTNTPTAFFSGNNFYTTAANRMSRHLFPCAITAEEVIELCKLNHL